MSNHSMQIIPDNVSIYGNISKQTFNGINTFDDWHLMPTSRLIISPPSVKTNYIDIPGANGIIDATEIMTGYPTYENRSGSLEFYVLNGHSVLSNNRRDQTWSKYGLWNNRYSEIMDFLHGRSMKLILDDDPEYYYRGRMSVNTWKSDKTFSKITLDYNLDPFKYEMFDSTEDWLWDPFSFVDGIIRNRNYYSFTVGPDTDSHIITVPLRSMPVTPEFLVQCTSTISSGSTVQLKLNKWNKADTAVEMTKDINLADTNIHRLTYYDIVFTEGSNKIGFRSAAQGNTFKITVKVRGGRL